MWEDGHRDVLRHVGALAQHILDALLHLLSRLSREGHREDLVRWDPASRQLVRIG